MCDIEKRRQLAIELARIADGAHCQDVTILDLRSLSPVTDFFVICSGTSDRQMRTAAEEMVDYGKRINERAFSATGKEAALWILIDFIHVVAHIFTPEHREYYDLELLWGDAPRVEWRMSATA
jgi:ribosome-associated protein